MICCSYQRDNLEHREPGGAGVVVADGEGDEAPAALVVGPGVGRRGRRGRGELDTVRRQRESGGADGAVPLRGEARDRGVRVHGEAEAGGAGDHVRTAARGLGGGRQVGESRRQRQLCAQQLEVQSDLANPNWTCPDYRVYGLSGITDWKS